MPLDFIRDYKKFEEKKTDKKKAQHLDIILKTYIDVNSPKELNLSGKDRKGIIEEIQKCGQLNNTDEWVCEKEPSVLLFSIFERARADLKDDSFGRFIMSDFWTNLIPKYIKNPDVMERLKIFDAEQKNERFEFQKPNLSEISSLKKSKKDSGHLSTDSETMIRKLSLKNFNVLKKLSEEEENFLKQDKKHGNQYLSKGIDYFKQRNN